MSTPRAAPRLLIALALLLCCANHGAAAQEPHLALDALFLRDASEADQQTPPTAEGPLSIDDRALSPDGLLSRYLRAGTPIGAQRLGLISTVSTSAAPRDRLRR